MEHSIDDSVVKYYIDVQKKKEEDIVYYLKNYKIPLIMNIILSIQKVGVMKSLIILI